MSGIAGVWYFDERPVPEADLHVMGQVLAHRGPDAIQCRIVGNVGMVHCLLRTSPESFAEDQPLQDTAHGHLLTADARLDNRDELLAELGLNYPDPREIADSRIILAAYNKWGGRCAERLIGDFAFALWDATSRTLFCARDHMGIRPFYYYHDQHCLVFASEIKALFQLTAVPRRINEQRVYDYLVFYYSDPVSTFFRDVRRLPAKHCLRVAPDSLQVRQYWDFSPGREIRLHSSIEYAEAFLAHFNRAVSCRLASTYPIGAFLSGGLDSSSIVCIAQQHLARQDREPLATFSEVFDNLPHVVRQRTDERGHMEAVISHCRPRPFFVSITDQSPLAGIDSPSYDEPMPYYNGYLFAATCEAACSQGVRVLLDGTDGDTTVSHGFERLFHLGTSFRLVALQRESAAYCRRHGIAYRPWGALWRYCLRPCLADQLVTGIKRLIGRPTHLSPLNLAGLRPDFRQSYDWQGRSRQLGKGQSLCRQGRTPQYQSFTSPLQQYTMEFIDSRLAGRSLEIRYPFWDRRLMEFCLAVPLAEKLNNGWSRAVLRNAMHGILPEQVERRIGKADLSPYFLLSLAEKAKPYVDRILHTDSLVLPYVDRRQVAAWWDEYRREPLRGEQQAMMLYKIISLESWLNNFFQATKN